MNGWQELESEGVEKPDSRRTKKFGLYSYDDEIWAPLKEYKQGTDEI